MATHRDWERYIRKKNAGDLNPTSHFRRPSKRKKPTVRDTTSPRYRYKREYTEPASNPPPRSMGCGGWGIWPGCCCHYDSNGDYALDGGVCEVDCLNPDLYDAYAWSCCQDCGSYSSYAGASFCGMYTCPGNFDYAPSHRFYLDNSQCEGTSDLLCWEDITVSKPHALIDFGYQVLYDRRDPTPQRPGPEVGVQSPQSLGKVPKKGWEGNWHQIFDRWDPNPNCKDPEHYGSWCQGDCDRGFISGQSKIPHFTIDWFQEFNIVLTPRRLRSDGTLCTPSDTTTTTTSDPSTTDDPGTTTASPERSGEDDECMQRLEIDWEIDNLPFEAPDGFTCTDSANLSVPLYFGAYNVYLDSAFLPERGQNKLDGFSYSAEPCEGYPGGVGGRTIKLTWLPGDSTPKYLKFRFDYESARNAAGRNGNAVKESFFGSIRNSTSNDDRWYFPWNRARSYLADDTTGLSFKLKKPQAPASPPSIAWAQYHPTRGWYYWGNNVLSTKGQVYERTRDLHIFKKAMVNYTDHDPDYECWPREMDWFIPPWGDNVKEQAMGGNLGTGISLSPFSIPNSRCPTEQEWESKCCGNGWSYI